jgi:hypothetical protein
MPKAVLAERNEFGTQLTGRHMSNEFHSRFGSNADSGFNSHLNSQGSFPIFPLVR